MNYAKDYTEIKNISETIKYINLSKKHICLLFKLKEENVIIMYSSFMVNKLQDNPKDWPFEKDSMLDEYKKELDDRIFDFIRNDICLIMNE